MCKSQTNGRHTHAVKGTAYPSRSEFRTDFSLGELGDKFTAWICEELAGSGLELDWLWEISSKVLEGRCWREKQQELQQLAAALGEAITSFMRQNSSPQLGLPPSCPVLSPKWKKSYLVSALPHSKQHPAHKSQSTFHRPDVYKLYVTWWKPKGRLHKLHSVH